MLLVQTICAQGLWGFPKGKIEDNEDPLQCAIREVEEETGYDISPLIKEEWYVEGTWQNFTSSGFTGLYIISGVSMQTHFQSRTKAEIVRLKWFPLGDLFGAEKGLFATTDLKITANTFSMSEQLRWFLKENKLTF